MKAVEEEKLFLDPKMVMNEAFEKAIEKTKNIKFNDDDNKRKFAISYIIKYSIDRGIHYSNLELIRLYGKISAIFETSFEEIFLLDRKIRMNKNYELTEEDIKLISLISFFIKFFFQKSIK